MLLSLCTWHHERSEMLEGVGHEYLEEFFSKCEYLLADNGLFVLQVCSLPLPSVFSILCLISNQRYITFCFQRKKLRETLRVLPHISWMVNGVNRWPWLRNLTLRGSRESNPWPPQLITRGVNSRRLYTTWANPRGLLEVHYISTASSPFLPLSNMPIIIALVMM
jgi:hypothetical protein